MTKLVESYQQTRHCASNLAHIIILQIKRLGKKLNKKTKRLLVSLTLTLAVVLMVSTAFHFRLIQGLEWKINDNQLKWARAGTELPPELVTVMIDEASLQVLDQRVGRWPWPRSVWGDLLEFMSMAGAKGVIFDILFTERQLDENRQPSVHDQIFADMTRDTGMVTHAMQLVQDPGALPSQNNLPMPPGFEEQFALKNVEGFPPSPNNLYYIPFDGLYQGAQQMGVVEFSPDADGVYRRTKLIRGYLDKFYPTLSLTAAIQKLNFQSFKQDENGLHFDDMTVPLDRDGHYLVNFYEKQNTLSIGAIFATLEQIRLGNIEEVYTNPKYIKPDDFAGKVVFVGTSAVGLEDLKTTPVDGRLPGVFLHTSIAGNLITQDFIQQVPTHVTYLLILLFAIITLVMIQSFTHILAKLFLPFLLVVGYLAFTTYSLKEWNLLMDSLAPIMAVFLTWLLIEAYLSVTEGAEKRRVRQMLGQYVSPNALNKVLDNIEDQLKAEVGTRENMTIAFSDVRSFTSISEGLSAEQVVELLNIHLSKMVDVTFEEGGTMDKFVGDATMAFWGAPVPDKDHAFHATRCLIRMVRAMDEVNATLAEKGYAPIAMGAGANTADVVLGNIGSVHKLDYTVIGDGVNLASRLEGLTKNYGVGCIISEFTHEQLKDRIPCVLLDMVRVKGKKEPIRIYHPLALDTDPEEQIIEAWKQVHIGNEAFAAYHMQAWDIALERFSALDDNPFARLKEIYAERIQHFKDNPPGEDWDGVFTFTTK